MVEGRITRLNRSICQPLLAAAVMFVGFFVVGMLSVQRRLPLGVDVPRSKILTMGGFLTGAARALGMSSLTRHELSIVYICTVVVLFGVYVWTLIELSRNDARIGRAFIIGTSLIFCIWIFFAPPILAKDLFNYAAYGKAIAVHGRNPYIFPPSAFPGDHLVRYMDCRDAVSVYGPLFNYIAALVTLVAGKSVVANVVAFKLLSLVFFVAGMFVLDDLACRTKKPRRSFILLAAAWNPLLLINVVGGGHNDLIMILFILLGFLLYRKGYPVLAVSSLVLAAMIKSTAILFVVPMIVLFVRENAIRSLRQYLLALVAIVAIPLILYLPCWPGIKGLSKTLTVASSFSGSSVPYLISHALGFLARSTGASEAAAHTMGHDLALGVALGFFLAVFVFLCYRVRDYRGLLYYSGAIALAFLFTTSWLMEWYAGFVIVLVAICGSRLITWAGVALTFVLSFYGRHIVAPLDFWFVSISLLVILVVLLYFLKKKRKSSLNPAG